MSPNRSPGMVDIFKGVPGVTANNFNEIRGGDISNLSSDPYNTQFSKTDATAMSNIMKNGIEFNDLQSQGLQKQGKRETDPTKS